MIPLSEDCGFIEWVPQTVTLRKVCEETYAAEGTFDKTSLATCKKILDNFTVSCWCRSPGAEPPSSIGYPCFCGADALQH